MLEGYKHEDPPPSHKLAVPVTVIHEILHATAENFTPRRGVIANLCTIAFYFLLRSVEYSDTGKENTRTHGFTLGDITFWHNDIRIPITAHPSLFFTADAATLRIQNQKNGFAGETIHQEATYKLDCPVAALARIANDIIRNTTKQQNINNIPICAYWTKRGEQKLITSKVITSTVRAATRSLNLEKQGIDPSQVGSHSLRAGGAMALHLAGEPAHVIRKMGRWQSDAFLCYLHAQMSCFSKGLSSLMSTVRHFVNVARSPTSTELTQTTGPTVAPVRPYYY